MRTWIHTPEVVEYKLFYPSGCKVNVLYEPNCTPLLFVIQESEIFIEFSDLGDRLCLIG